MPQTLVIVPCGGQKVWEKNPDYGPALAQDAYTGAPFRVNRAYAESVGDAWVILSAKYGFILPTFSIPEPYNVTFKRRIDARPPLTSYAGKSASWRSTATRTSSGSVAKNTAP